MGTIDSTKSVLTQSALDALCKRFHIPDVVHPELPVRNDRIRNSPVSKIGLSVFAAAKVFRFEIVPPPWLYSNHRKDPHPTPAEFNADVCNYLADDPAPFRKFLEPFLFFVGISRYYDLDENCYPTFWANDDEGGCSFACVC
ncbi:hypothetical protein Tco_1217603 [Tanacetum coccineum]